MLYYFSKQCINTVMKNSYFLCTFSENLFPCRVQLGKFVACHTEKNLACNLKELCTTPSFIPNTLKYNEFSYNNCIMRFWLCYVFKSFVVRYFFYHEILTEIRMQVSVIKFIVLWFECFERYLLHVIYKQVCFWLCSAKQSWA